MITKVCIVDTTYTLSLYLLKMNMSEIRQTLFIIGNTIDSEMQAKLLHHIYINMEDVDWTKSWRERLIYRLQILKKIFYIYFPWIKIYAQDHLAYSDIVIWKKKYTLMEDSPEVFQYVDTVSFLKPFEPYKGENWKWKLKYHLVHGPIYGKKFGINSQCINRWVTSKQDLSSPYIKGKNHVLLDYQELWRNSNREKQEYILSVFGLSSELIEEWKHNELLICSQPFQEDCNLTDAEMIELYKPYIEKYKSTLIKVHPRDHFKYIKYFPNVSIMKTKVPMQFLNIIGLNFPVALTVSSTALSSIPMDTQKIYLGTKINSKIFEVYGDIHNS